MLNTGAGKQLYRSIVARSSAPMPAMVEGMPDGHDRGRARGQVGAVQQVPFAQVGVAVQEHPAVRGTPSRRAAATDISSTAAPWLTFSRATM